MELAVGCGQPCHRARARLVRTAAEVEDAARRCHRCAVADGVRHLRVIRLDETVCRRAQDIDIGIGHLRCARERSAIGEVRAAADDDVVAERPLHESRDPDVLRISCGGRERADRLPCDRGTPDRLRCGCR